MAGAAIGVVVLFLAAAPFGANANTDSNDVNALNVFYTTMNSPPQLTNWVSQNGDPCGQSWLGVTCSGSRVTTIKLSGMQLNGTLGYNMNQLTALAQLLVRSFMLSTLSAPMFKLKMLLCDLT
jgi:hypothetical protein